MAVHCSRRCVSFWNRLSVERVKRYDLEGGWLACLILRYGAICIKERWDYLDHFLLFCHGFENLRNFFFPHLFSSFGISLFCNISYHFELPPRLQHLLASFPVCALHNGDKSFKLLELMLSPFCIFITFLACLIRNFVSSVLITSLSFYSFLRPSAYFRLRHIVILGRSPSSVSANSYRPQHSKMNASVKLPLCRCSNRFRASLFTAAPPVAQNVPSTLLQFG